MVISLVFYTIIFIFGLTVGSFLNCVIFRLQKDEEFLIKRSYCPHCQHTLNWQDLIPLLSFVFLKGKCRYCQDRISFQYPLVELVIGLLFVFAAQRQLTVSSEYLTPLSLLSFCYLLIVFCFLVIIFVFDLRHYIIPDKIIYPAVGIAFLYRLFEFSQFSDWNLFGNWKLVIGNLQPLMNPLLSAILASAFFLLIILISKGRWMGWGDVKLAFFMGLLLGFPNILLALFLAFSLGAIIGVGLILANKKGLKSEIPFGPFLVTGTFIALFWGKEIIQLYFSLFLT